MKRSTVLCITLNLFAVETHVQSLSQDNRSTLIRQETLPLRQEPLADDFTQHLWSWSLQTGPIGPTELNYFITHVYNCPLYAQDYIPNTFADITRFLKHGNDTYKNRAYVQQVLRLFANKLKSCQYVNTQALCQLLDELPKLLERHFVAEKLFDVDLVQRHVSRSIATYLNNTNKPSSTQQGINELSKEIAQALDEQYRTKLNTTSIQELRKTLHTFLEIALSKLIWSPEDGIQTWQYTKKISYQLTHLMEHGIIQDIDDLNDIFITLLERYCHFLELMAEDLTPDFYLAVGQDLQKSLPPLLDLEEQEAAIEPKLQRFKRTLAQTESIAQHAFERKQLYSNAQKIAQEHGIIMGTTKVG